MTTYKQRPWEDRAQWLLRLFLLRTTSPTVLLIYIGRANHESNLQ